MPYGFERLNERSQRPNALINFIKPLEGPNKALAEAFLNRIAAQCYPVMKAAHISVMSLEEYEPNSEFLGRNFNAGECVQLVLKNKQGQWLGFKYVQMVMMHELAHCKQMNHSRDFWKVRNGFAEELEVLWKKHYSGEGVWGRGQDLSTGSFMLNHAVEPGSVPQHLCGGTYRRRGRKRKRVSQAAESLTYAERQQRRIARKFGKHGDGNELGENELVRGAYEQGNRHYGKPRVAGSKRGRELRAQAALARFGAAKAEHNHKPEASSSGGDSGSDTEWSESEYGGEEQQKDSARYVRICDEEDEDDENADQEMNALQALSQPATEESRGSTLASKAHADVRVQELPVEELETESETDTASVMRSDVSESVLSTNAPDAENKAVSRTPDLHGTGPIHAEPKDPSSSVSICPVCSLENVHSALICEACSNVLRPRLVKDSWRCAGQHCQGSAYLNAGDVGRCGVCGSSKPSRPPVSISVVGTVNPSILRWD